MKSWGVGLAALALIAATAARAQTPEENTGVVRAFLDMVFNQHKVAQAFADYVGPTYTQHNPYVPDGIAGGVKGLGGLVARNPKMHIYIKRTIAEGDLVVDHNLTTDKPGDRGNAIIDIFRLENGKIVEHWDVVQAVPATHANNNTIF